MFYHLYGNLEIAEAGLVVIDCNGVGYKLTTSQITSELLREKLGTEVKIFTELVVREDAAELYGFESKEERECFNLLVTVSGVGPKAAMSILSIMTPANLSAAIVSEDAKAISKANGIGSKTAARIVLELKDKVSADVSVAAPKTVQKAAPTVPKSGNLAAAADALMNLGYDKNATARALYGLDPNAPVGELIRLALRTFAK